MQRFLVHQVPVAGPATRAILIGVGSYAHLRGGSGALAPGGNLMGQLTSPPVSARALADWLIEHLDAPGKPLAEVALLLSEDSPKPYVNPVTKAAHQVEVATIDNIEAALSDWRDRATDPADRLIFFFSGHGMARAGTEMVLLAADYGAKVNNPLDGAFDFRNMAAAMDLCPAREQLYFVDACRDGGTQLLRAGSYNGRPVFLQDLLAPANPVVRNAPVFYAALPGQAAYSLPGVPSIYTTALIKSLSGFGADDNDGFWAVTTSRLREAMEFFMAQHARANGLGRLPVPASDDQGRLVIHVPKEPPQGVAIVECLPIEATDLAELSCLQGRRSQARRAPQPGEWLVELPADVYTIRAEFPSGQYQPAKVRAIVRPTYCRYRIKV